MKKKQFVPLALLFAFAIWTAMICLIDVQAIGPNGATVGFATLNSLIHRITGVHMTLYVITDWLGLVPVAFALGFAVLGLIQWIGRGFEKVDRSLFVLGGFYLLVLSSYLLFEEFVINFRPVLIDGYLEASYPSSTTLLTLCVMPTAIMQFNERIRSKAIKRWVCWILCAFTAFMVIGRLISGVHWFTDIVGGALLSGGLVGMYKFVCKAVN